jgi:hypothetical protein
MYVYLQMRPYTAVSFQIIHTRCCRLAHAVNILCNILIVLINALMSAVPYTCIYVPLNTLRFSNIKPNSSCNLHDYC